MTKSGRSPKREMSKSADHIGFSGAAFELRADFGLRDAIAKVAPFLYPPDPFPLTPALSLRERENQGPRCANSKRLRLSNTLTMMLPPPEGEGWGEGEGALETEDHGSLAIGSRPSDFGLRISIS